MDSVRVIYVGQKPIKEDNIAGTGAVWRGEGDVQNVPLAAWPKLAPHRGIWQLAEGVPVKTLASAPAPPVSPPAAAPVASTAPAQTPVVTLYGANLDAHIDIGGHSVQLGAIVAVTQERSGLTPEDWNGLDDAERTTRCEAFIAEARAEAAADKAKREAAGAADAPLTHAQLKVELKRMQVPFKGNPSKEALQALYDEHKAKG